VVRLFGGFRMVADVDVPATGASGVLAAMGDWTGGLAFYVRDGRLVFVLNRAGDEGRVESDVLIPAGRHRLAVVYTPGLAGRPAAATVRRVTSRVDGIQTPSRLHPSV